MPVELSIVMKWGFVTEKNILEKSWILLLLFVMPNDKIVFLASYHFHLHLGLKWYGKDRIYIFVKSSTQWYKEFLNYVYIAVL